MFFCLSVFDNNSDDDDDDEDDDDDDDYDDYDYKGLVFKCR